MNREINTIGSKSNDFKLQNENYNIETRGDELCNASFELAPHQYFVKNFMSNNTPYNSILLFHGTGVGKTCSSLLISDNFKEYVKKNNINSYQVWDDNKKDFYRNKRPKNLNKALKNVNYIVLSPGISLKNNNNLSKFNKDF
mgnify:CR=1 FL=1